MTFSRRDFMPLITLAAFSPKLSLLADSKGGEKVKQVSGQFVCMINKKHFQKEQKPVLVESRIYYACCDVCATRLRDDANALMDVDPLSGKAVDKAISAIGVDKAGNVYFFESAENLKKFRIPVNASN